METKKCTKCGEVKPIDAFSFYTRKDTNKIQFKSWCKHCCSADSSKRQKENREKYKDRRKAYREKHKEHYAELYKVWCQKNKHRKADYDKKYSQSEKGKQATKRAYKKRISTGKAKQIAAKYRKELHDIYVVNNIHKATGIPMSKISKNKELIDSYRMQIACRRAIKQLKNKSNEQNTKAS